ncbi:hypothetical protein [Streptomyces sp. BV129]|uniref:hypothetical protein n=1 Tax=Streptomyces sp. BV129 TaxID=2849671 RepID=UPI001C2DFC8B|nr:hypothetical protein [Streptomyces sp. BV129]MBV1949394.1 hypothetical protein [Streptomyces sp. BV129]
MTVAHEHESGVEEDFLEDIFVTDVGLTWLASRWQVLDEVYAELAGPNPLDGGHVTVWLRLAESSVDQFDRSKAAQLGQDVQRLLRSPLPEETVRTVWLAATHGIFDPREQGMSARSWLRRAEEAWLARVREDDPAFVPPPPQPVTDEKLRRAVLQEIHPVARRLDLAAEHPPFGTPVTGLVQALEQVVTESCADLGYRLFLRAMKAYQVSADKPSLVALGERFGYPHGLVHKGLNSRPD